LRPKGRGQRVRPTMPRGRGTPTVGCRLQDRQRCGKADPRGRQAGGRGGEGSRVGEVLGTEDIRGEGGALQPVADVPPQALVGDQRYCEKCGFWAPGEKAGPGRKASGQKCLSGSGGRSAGGDCFAEGRGIIDHVFEGSADGGSARSSARTRIRQETSGRVFLARANTRLPDPTKSPRGDFRARTRSSARPKGGLPGRKALPQKRWSDSVRNGWRDSRSITLHRAHGPGLRLKIGCF